MRATVTTHNWRRAEVPPFSELRLPLCKVSLPAPELRAGFESQVCDALSQWPWVLGVHSLINEDGQSSLGSGGAGQ